MLNRVVQFGPAGAVVLGLIVLFHVHGNTADSGHFGKSMFHWLFKVWDSGDGRFSHGYLIPFVSLFLVWRRRGDLAEVDKRPANVGLWLIIACLALHVVGLRVRITTLSVMAFIGLTWSIPLYLYGWAVARILLFPCAYLVFCIPFGFLEGQTLSLRLLASASASGLLNGLGIPVERVGTVIRSVAGQGLNIDVDDPCSGLKYLLTLTSVTTAYAYLAMRTIPRKWILFFAAIPIAVAGNIARVVAIAVAAVLIGQDFAVGLYHDYSGYIVFVVSTLLMIMVGAIVNKDFRVWTAQLKAHH